MTTTKYFSINQSRSRMSKIQNQFEMFAIILCLCLQIHIILSQEYSCESETFRCESYLKQSDCPLNEFLEIDHQNSGCCPTCRGGLGMSILSIVNILY